MMPIKPSRNLLPAASGVLPESPASNVVQLRERPRRRPQGAGTISITKASLKRLVCPQDRDEAFYWDDQVRGLGLRAYASGKRVWLLQYRDANGRTRRIVLGGVDALDPEAARMAARGELTQKAIGQDPAARRKADKLAMRVGELVESYLAYQAAHRKPSTLDQTTRNLNKYGATLQAEPLAAVDRAAIHRLHKRLTGSAGPVQANRTLASLSAMFSWAMRAGLAKDNPAAFVPKNPEAPKDRILSDDELRAIWKATETKSDFNRIVRLLMLTGCRRDEIGGAKWNEIDGSLLTIAENRTKTSISHEVPLSELAIAHLPERREGRDSVFGEGREGFSGWSRSKARLDRAIARPADETGNEPRPCMPEWGLHDFRRTLSTRLNEAGTDPHVVEAILGHAGARRGVAGVYNRASYREQKSAALAAWARMIAAIVEQGGNASLQP
jgi:integrase